HPLLMAVAPHSPWTYVLFFGLLSPLALYRGPFNLYGLGAGIGGILTTLLAPTLVMGALMCTGMVQGVCDPTNTMNVWVAGFTRTDVNDILKSTLPYVFMATLTALLVIALTRW
ncbi:MAG: H+/gluconate symporter family protein, partial [Chthonomonadales bacterium]|nr:H+/gluconate symporter family protein [Chthonomonadales bacterium]